MSTPVCAPTGTSAAVLHTHVNHQPPSYVTLRLWGEVEQLLSYKSEELGKLVAAALEQHLIDERAEHAKEEVIDDIPF